MSDSDNNQQQPKFRSGPIVVWVSVGIAVIWAALFAFLRLWSQLEAPNRRLFHRHDSRLQRMLRKLTWRAPMRSAADLSRRRSSFEKTPMDTLRADRFRSGRPVRLPLGSLPRSSNQVSRQS